MMQVTTRTPSGSISASASSRSTARTPGGNDPEPVPAAGPQVAPFFEALPPRSVAIETCGGGHHWGRVLGAMGHSVKLIPAQFVKPCLKSNKNDAVDAAAICEAAQRPTMRLAKVKTAEDQAMLALHRTRRLLIKQRTQLGNSPRGQCA